MFSSRTSRESIIKKYEKLLKTHQKLMADKAEVENTCRKYAELLDLQNEMMSRLAKKKKR